MGTQFSLPYSIVLRQYPALPLRDRLIAQDRFGSALESQLGGAAAVVAAFRAAGLDSAPQTGHERDAALMHWSAAARGARQIGLRGLACPADAYFEVALVEAPEQSPAAGRQQPASRPVTALAAKPRAREQEKEAAPVAADPSARPRG